MNCPGLVKQSTACLCLLVLTFTAWSHAATTQPSTQPLGATPHADGTTTFRVWAPLVDSVSVKVNVAPPVELDKETGHSDDDATWVKTVPGAKAGDQYKYQIQAGGQTREFVNPRSRQLTGSGPDAASVIVDTADVVQPFDGPTFNNLVIYELHVGTFHAGKDGKFNFAGVAEKLDYLKDLGVNAIQLTVRSFSEPLLRNGKLLVSC